MQEKHGIGKPEPRSNIGCAPDVAVRTTVCDVILIGSVLLTLVLPSAGWAQSFGVGVRLDFPTGSSPQSVAIGDLNGDGKLDLVVVNNGSSTVSVLLANGAGGFGAKTDFATGSSPQSVAIGDLNGDGRPDLAVANGGYGGSNTVSVLLGNGAGGFGAKTDFATGDAPFSVAIGDVNGDDKPDLVVANINSNTVSVLLGNGAGGFGAKTDFATGSAPISVAIGDVSGDGKPDLAVADNGANTVSVLLGNGAGGFGAKTDFATGSTPNSVAIGDVNGDGKPDLAVANYGSNTVSVLLGNGAGGFGAKTDFATGANPYWVAIGDVSGDGKPDLAVANWISNTVSVLLGNGAGGFGAKTDFASGSGPVSVAIGDVNGDGRPDLAVANFNSNTVSVLLTTAGFGLKTDFLTGSGPSSVAIRDLNADGKPDVLDANLGDNAVSVLLGNGAGGFAPKTNFTTGTGSSSIAVGDFNGDGQPDIAVSNYLQGTVSVYLGQGTGSFGARTDFGAGIGCYSVATGDVNGDGNLDLAVANTSASTVSVLLGNGTGGFGPKTDFATGIGSGPVSVAIGDMNGDGKPDLAVANQSNGTAAVLLGNGTGGFGIDNDFATGSNPASVAIGDLNGDGKPDLVVANQGSNTVSVLLGPVGLTPKTDFSTGGGPHSVAIGDVNGDGKPDLVVVNTYTYTVSVLLGNGVGGFGPKTDFATGINPFSVAIGDLNGDGRLDLLVANYTSSTVSVLLALESTRTVLTMNSNPALLGSALTITATITVVAPGTGNPTGTMSFFDGTTLLGTSPVNQGVASLSMFAPYLGTRALSAVYSGDAKLLGSISPTVTERVVSTAAPSMAGISDVRNDQGRWVRVLFNRSAFDYLGSAIPITSYQIYRRAIVANAALSPAGEGTHALLSTTAAPAQIAVAGWDYLATVPATTDNIYETVAPTAADSNSTGFHRAVLFVRAATGTPGVYYDSAPDSGYSVDNLSPPPPAPFAAAYTAGATHLHWGVSSASDFGTFRLYRGASADFTPGPGNLVAATNDTGYVDAGPAGSYYKLSAVDFNGNESPFALVTPAGTTGVGSGTLPNAVYLAAPEPNPARGRAVFHFGLPRAASVSLNVYDVSGRLVDEIARGRWEAGDHVVNWGLRTQTGAEAAAGLYFVRLSVDGSVRTERLAVEP